MNSDPIIEELWRIKDEIAREAGNDVHLICENARRWVADHPHDGPVISSAEELRRSVEDRTSEIPPESTPGE